jgi:hypothetical protein
MPDFYKKYSFLLFYLTTLLSVFYPFFLRGQTNRPPLERVITVKAQNMPTESVLEQIADQGDVEFSYSPQVVDPQKKVNVNVENKTIREALDVIFQGNIKVKSRSNYLILTKKPETNTSKKITLTGYISDAHNQKKIPQTSIYEVSSLSSALSNQYGYYEIKLTTTQNTLVLTFQKENYQPQTLTVNAKENTLLNVSLVPLPQKTKITPIKPIDSLRVSHPDSLSRIDTNSLVLFLIPASQRAHSRNLKENFFRKVQASFLPFVGSNHRLSGNVVNDFSFNALVGYSAGTRKFELGGIANVNRGSMQGWQIAGMVNLVGETVDGIQIGGISNVVADSVRGVQVGGIANANKNSMTGVQVGGIINVNGGDFTGTQVGGIVNVGVKSVYGVQVGGIANLVQDSIRGIQIGGIANINGHKTEGLQIGGITNINVGSMKGAQVAGIANFTLGELKGTQVSGIFNFSRKSKSGWQVGLVNYTDSAANVKQIGLINFVRKGGYKNLEIGVNENIFYTLNIRSGMLKFYTQFTFGMRQTDGRPFWYYGYGFGTGSDFGKGWGWNNELTYNTLLRTLKDKPTGNNFFLRFQTHFSKKLAPRWALTAGLASNLFSRTLAHPDYPVAEDLVNNSVWERFSEQRHWQITWAWQAGIRFGR